MENNKVNERIGIESNFVPVFMRVQPKLAGINLNKYGYWSFGFKTDYDEMMGRDYKRKIGVFLCRKDLYEDLVKVINETQFLSKEFMDAVDRTCKKFSIYKKYDIDKTKILIEVHKGMKDKEENVDNLSEVLNKILDELREIEEPKLKPKKEPKSEIKESKPKVDVTDDEMSGTDDVLDVLGVNEVKESESVEINKNKVGNKDDKKSEMEELFFGEDV